jgi:hypothetical protein
VARGEIDRQQPSRLMDVFRPAAEGSAADEGDLRLSWRVISALAGIWTFVAVAFFIAWLPDAKYTKEPWPSEALWLGPNYLLWLLISPIVLRLSNAYPISGDARARYVPIHGLAAFTLSAVHLLVFLVLQRATNPWYHYHLRSLWVGLRDSSFYRIATGIVTYGVLLFAFSVEAANRRARRDERRSNMLQRELAEAELRALRMQIHPHFLFNALHSISSLVYDAPSEALAMMSRLGEFLRATLDKGAAPQVTLSEELRYAALYLEIEKVRFGDRLQISIAAAPEALDMETPTLILQPLIENAIRHGLGCSMGVVELSIAAERLQERLYITLTNREADPAPRRTVPHPLPGLGLANTRDRLETAYGSLAALEFSVPAPGAFKVTMCWPAHRGA